MTSCVGMAGVRRRFQTVGVLALTLASVAFSGTASAATNLSGVEGTSIGGDLADLSPQCPTVVSSTIAWGDGTSSAGQVSQADISATFNVSGTHVYARYGAYSGSVSLVLRCNDNSMITEMGTFTATVTDAALTATGVNVSAHSGQSFTAAVAHVVDANPDGVASDDTATITWGDGSTSAGTVSAAPGGGFSVSGTHTYGANGSYSVAVSVLSSGTSHTSRDRDRDRNDGAADRRATHHDDAYTDADTDPAAADRQGEFRHCRGRERRARDARRERVRSGRSHGLLLRLEARLGSRARCGLPGNRAERSAERARRSQHLGDTRHGGSGHRGHEFDQPAGLDPLAEAGPSLG